MKIIWHNKAKIDLNNNISYIAKHSPQNALKVLNEIIELQHNDTKKYVWQKRHIAVRYKLFYKNIIIT